MHRRVEVRERVAVRADQAPDEPAHAVDQRGLEDEVAPEAAGAGRHERLEPRLHRADHVRVHPAHRLPDADEVLGVEAERGRARGEGRPVAAREDRGRDLEVGERPDQEPLLDHALPERPRERREVVEVQVLDRRRARQPVRAERERRADAREAVRRDHVGGPGAALLGPAPGRGPAVDDLRGDPAAPVEVDHQRVAGLGHLDLRDRDDHPRVLAALLDRRSVGAEDEVAVRVERRRPDLELRLRDGGDELAVALVRGSVGGVDREPLHGHGERREGALAHRVGLGDHVARREDRRRRDLGAGHPDPVEGLEHRPVERRRRSPSRAGGRLPVRELRDHFVHLERRAVGVPERAQDHERVGALGMEHDARERRDPEQVVARVEVGVERDRDGREERAAVRRVGVHVDEEHRRARRGLDHRVDGSGRERGAEPEVADRDGRPPRPRLGEREEVVDRPHARVRVAGEIRPPLGVQAQVAREREVVEGRRPIERAVEVEAHRRRRRRARVFERPAIRRRGGIVAGGEREERDRGHAAERRQRHGGSVVPSRQRR